MFWHPYHPLPTPLSIGTVLRASWSLSRCRMFVMICSCIHGIPYTLTLQTHSLQLEAVHLCDLRPRLLSSENAGRPPLSALSQGIWTFTHRRTWSILVTWSLRLAQLTAWQTNAEIRFDDKTSGYAMVVHGRPQTPQIQVFGGHRAPWGRTAPIFYGTQLDPDM